MSKKDGNVGETEDTRREVSKFLIRSSVVYFTLSFTAFIFFFFVPLWLFTTDNGDHFRRTIATVLVTIYVFGSPVSALILFAIQERKIDKLSG